MEKPRWRVRSSSYVVDSPFLRLRKDEVELPDGTIVEDYYVRESRGFVIVLAITPDGDAVLVEQYRYGNDSIIIELPAGTIDGDEDALVCARRELAEETGYGSEDWELVLATPTEPVRSNSIMHCYVARNAVRVAEQSLDATEHIEVLRVPLRELRDMLRTGRIQSVASIAAAYAALEHLAF